MIESNESINSIDTHKILATIPIMPYQNILCVGAEEGLFPVLFGKFVFDGKVIVFESDKKNIDKTKKILKKINLGNVELDNLTGNKISLKDKIDGIFSTVLDELLSNSSSTREFDKTAKNILSSPIDVSTT